MNILQEIQNGHGKRFSVQVEGKEVGHAYLYILTNDLHERPFGFLEDVHLDESVRGQGIGKILIKEIIDEAKAQNCYKLIGTSRYERDMVHQFYKKLGFDDYGKEFRLNFE